MLNASTTGRNNALQIGPVGSEDEVSKSVSIGLCIPKKLRSIILRQKNQNMLCLDFLLSEKALCNIGAPLTVRIKENVDTIDNN